MATVLLFYARRVAFSATLILLVLGIPRVVGDLSGNATVDLVAVVAIFAAIFFPIALALDDVEHGLLPFNGRFSRR